MIFVLQIVIDFIINVMVDRNRFLVKFYRQSQEEESDEQDEEEIMEIDFGLESSFLSVRELLMNFIYSFFFFYYNIFYLQLNF